MLWLNFFLLLLFAARFEVIKAQGDEGDETEECTKKQIPTAPKFFKSRNMLLVVARMAADDEIEMTLTGCGDGACKVLSRHADVGAIDDADDAFSVKFNAASLEKLNAAKDKRWEKVKERITKRLEKVTAREVNLKKKTPKKEKAKERLAEALKKVGERKDKLEEKLSTGKEGLKVTRRFAVVVKSSNEEEAPGVGEISFSGEPCKLPDAVTIEGRKRTTTTPAPTEEEAPITTPAPTEEEGEEEGGEGGEAGEDKDEAFREIEKEEWW